MTTDEIIRLIDEKAVDADLRREAAERHGSSWSAAIHQARAKIYADLADELRRMVQADKKKQEAKP